jgi:hypothetical protein
VILESKALALGAYRIPKNKIPVSIPDIEAQYFVGILIFGSCLSDFGVQSFSFGSLNSVDICKKNSI